MKCFLCNNVFSVTLSLSRLGRLSIFGFKEISCPVVRACAEEKDLWVAPRRGEQLLAGGQQESWLIL